ncbi:MAG: hypothetical protein II295_03580 [Akkermansia sp.]|nr:hypothetical protein [Akkermansia sp.]
MKKKIDISPVGRSKEYDALAKALAPIIRRMLANPNIVFVRPVGNNAAKR